MKAKTSDNMVLMGQNSEGCHEWTMQIDDVVTFNPKFTQEQIAERLKRAISNIEKDRNSLAEQNKRLREMLEGVLLMGRGASGRIIIEGWQEETIRAALKDAQ